MTSQTGLYEGDRIRVDMNWGVEDFTIERFRDCLGFFPSNEAREAGAFIPLCSMYGHGAGSEYDYIPNYGEYVKNPVAQWMQLPKENCAAKWRVCGHGAKSGPPGAEPG